MRIGFAGPVNAARWMGADTDARWRCSDDTRLALLREWGGFGSRGAAHNVGIVRGTMKAAVDRMSAADRAEFGVWFDNLTSAEAHSVLRAIVTA